MSKSHLRSTTAVLLTTLVAATPALAQEAEADAGFLGTLFLTFGKRDVSINSPVSTTVLDEDELEDRQASTLAEALVTIPGVTLANGYSAQAAGVNIRGFGTDSTFGGDQSVVFLEDGATVGAEPLYRISTQAFTDPLLYKSVEVRRGTIGSFEFGSGIMGGVVISETKDASDFTDGEPGFKIGQTLEYSSNGNGLTSSTTLAWQPSENIEILGNYVLRKSDDYQNGDGTTQPQTDSDMPSALLKGKFTFGQDNEHALTLSYKQSTSDDKDVSFDFIDPDGRFRRVDRVQEDKVTSLTYTYSPVDNDLIDFTAQLTRSDRFVDNNLIAGVDYTSPTSGDLSGFYGAEFEYVTTKLLLKNNALFSTGMLKHDLTFGVEVSDRERSHNAASSAVGGTNRRIAIFAVDDINVTDTFSLTPALRFEKSKLDPVGTSDFARPVPNTIEDTYEHDAWMGGLAAKYEFENGLSVFGSAAYSVSLPGIGSAWNAPQKSRTYELGASFASTDVFSAGDNLSIRGNFYKTHVWDVTGDVDTIDSTGLELEASYGLENGTYFDVNANIVDGTETLTTGASRVWASLPSDSVNLTVGKKWGDMLDLSWELTHHAAAKRHNRTFTGTTVVDTDSWTTHNLRATYKPQEGLLEGFEMRVGIDNLFDTTYRANLATYDAPGRNIKFTLSKVF